MSGFYLADLERARRRRAVAILAVFVAVLLVAAYFASSSSVAGAPSGADRPDTTDAAAPAAVSGPAASGDLPQVARTDAAPSVTSPTLPPTVLLSSSGAAAGGEGRQGAPESDLAAVPDDPAAPSSAPAGPHVPTRVRAAGGLALEIPSVTPGTAPGSPGPDAVPLPPVAAAIAACESGEIDADGRPVLGTYSLTAANPESSARGKYQAVTATWEWVTGLPAPASAYPEHVQDQFFVDLWDDGRGSSHWDASRWCWAGAA